MNPTLWYEEGYKYRTVLDYVLQTRVKPAKFILTDFIRLDTDGVMSIKAGYAWDGPSGPTFDTVDAMIGSLANDAFYQLMREGMLSVDEYRKPADRELWRLCVEDGMLEARADVWYVGVRGFARGAAETPTEVLSAPVAGIPLPA